MKDITLNRLLPTELYNPIVFSVAFILALGSSPTADLLTGAAWPYSLSRPALAVALPQPDAAPDAAAPGNTATVPGLFAPAEEFGYNSLANRLLHEAVTSVVGLFCEEFG